MRDMLAGVQLREHRVSARNKAEVTQQYLGKGYANDSHYLLFMEGWVHWLYTLLRSNKELLVKVGVHVVYLDLPLSQRVSV